MWWDHLDEWWPLLGWIPDAIEFLLTLENQIPPLEIYGSQLFLKSSYFPSKVNSSTLKCVFSPLRNYLQTALVSLFLHVMGEKVGSIMLLEQERVLACFISTFYVTRADCSTLTLQQDPDLARDV